LGTHEKSGFWSSEFGGICEVSEREWYLELRYGPLMEPFEDEYLLEIEISEWEFRRALDKFLDEIQSSGGKARNES